MLVELVELVEQVEALEVEMMTFSEKSRLFTIFLTFCLLISDIIIIFAFSIQYGYIVWQI